MKTSLFLAAFAAAVSADAAERVRNGSFVRDGDSWTVYRASHDPLVSRTAGGGSLKLAAPAGLKGQCIVNQEITLDQRVPATFAYSCWTKAEGLAEDAVPSHRTYGVELCVKYADGSQQWIAPQKKPGVGTHGWERLSGVFTPPRAVKSVVFYARLRLQGTVWYDDFSLDEFEPPREGLKGCMLTEVADTVTLENDYVKLVFEPANGGTCREFTVKADGANYAGEKHYESRMFADRLRVGGNCFKRVYKAEIVKNTPPKRN